jgi:DNA-binding NarL/FixJ family response regulator
MPVLNSELAHRPESPGAANSLSRADAKVSVIVVAAERLFRLGLARLLDEDERLDVIGVSEGQPELVDLCAANSVDVVLIDLDLTKADSMDLVRSIASQCPATNSLILASQADWRVRPAMVAGTAGILLKDTSPESIRAAVISVHLGDQVLCNEAARWVLGEEYSAHLTQRESDVLRIVAQGANNAEIAAQLNLGQKTVRNYVSRIYGKLELTPRLLAVRACRIPHRPTSSLSVRDGRQSTDHEAAQESRGAGRHSSPRADDCRWWDCYRFVTWWIFTGAHIRRECACAKERDYLDCHDDISVHHSGGGTEHNDDNSSREGRRFWCDHQTHSAHQEHGNRHPYPTDNAHQEHSNHHHHQADDTRYHHRRGALGWKLHEPLVFIKQR